MGNIIAPEKRLHLLAALVDGNSERAAARLSGVDRETVSRYAMIFGTAARHLHNTMAHDLIAPIIEQDEVWSYVGKKQARVTPEEHAAGYGEAYTFVGLAMPSRYVITWTTGKRDGITTDIFTADLRARVAVMPAMTSDGFAPYVSAVGKHFGPGVDYAQTVKHYTKGGRRDDDHRYEPPRNPFMTKHVVFGAPDLDAATTAHMERHNGTMRHFIGRMRRLVLAFSKSPEHHRAAVSLAYCFYNLCWIPRTLRITPAMAIGATTHPWDLPEFIDALLTVSETAQPVATPLIPRQPATTSRPLPNGRGFLRVVHDVGTPPAAPRSSPAPPPVAAAASSAATAIPMAPVVPAQPTLQLDLFAWTPPVVPPPATKRLDPGQLGLFGLALEPEPNER